MKRTLIFIFCCSSMLGYGQKKDTISKVDTQKFLMEAFESLNELTEKGLEMKGDSLVVNEELLRLMTDTAYRSQVYPDIYTWEEAINFMAAMKLKTAFWFFINLYPENETSKDAVLKAVLSYDRMMKMDEVLTNTFNTYCYADPEISVITDGKPEIIRPDIMETKLRTVKEIIQYIHAYREQVKRSIEQK